MAMFYLSGKSTTKISDFLIEARGTTAVEFALVAPLLLLTIFFILSVGYMMFMAQALDYATQKSARQIMTGQVQSSSLNQTQFRTQVVCPLLPSMFNCNNVIVNVQAVAVVDGSYPNEYYAFLNASQTGLSIPPLANAQTNYCPGQQQGYVYLQVLYPVSIFLSFLSASSVATTYLGQKVYLIMSTATFLNEPFVAPASSC
ncbi:TadE/TadG family type IV pilus assembly protein [Beijerinckia sp. L45]|uniref:TadE/TadG family type IV pilus assembly protein n=1 Tax=Beijerinckia sp. L45 TaxID=1641855 RepID=UPI001AEDC92C|nr:TadE/TadG family type IV pilus assembly protein [Beijerinckia sp. L45]